MLNHISGIVVLTLYVVALTGCSEYGTAGTMIEAVDIISISEERPAKVVIGVIGWHPCVISQEAKVYADREGRTIHLSATKNAPPRIGCRTAITHPYGEVTVGNLRAGKYKIVSDDRELLEFRIEMDAGYVVRKLNIKSVEVAAKTPDGGDADWVNDDVVTSEPVQVMLSVSGYFNSRCEYLSKTVVTRKNFFDSSPNLIVELYSERPINSDCLSVINPYGYISDDLPYENEIDLGPFSEGSYLVDVNSVYVNFRIHRETQNSD